jgi:hypothetical protein
VIWIFDWANGSARWPGVSSRPMDGQSPARASTSSRRRPGRRRFDSSDQDTLAYGPLPVRVQTADDGRFALGFPGQERFWLLVTAEGQPPLMFAPPQGVEPGKLEVRLKSPCTLEGTLHRRDGSAASHARLALVLPEPLPPIEGRTDETGRFVFEAIPPVPYALRLLEDPGDPSTSFSATGTLGEGERASRDAILDDGLAIRGRVLDGDRPVADGLVRLQENESDSMNGSVRTARDGSRRELLVSRTA